MSEKRISEKGISFIIDYEGFLAEAEDVEGVGGHLTIGHGHYGADVQESDTITREAAKDVLMNDLSRFENIVNSSITVDLKQHQFDALVSLAFNIGVYRFANSNLVEQYNQGNYGQVAIEWAEFRLVGGK